MELILRQQFTAADTAAQIGQTAVSDKGTQLNFGVKIRQVSLLFKMSQRLYDWLFCIENFGNFEYCTKVCGYMSGTSFH